MKHGFVHSDKILKMSLQQEEYGGCGHHRARADGVYGEAAARDSHRPAIF